MDPTALQDAVESLRAYLDTILEARVPEAEAPSTERAEDTVLDALLSTAIALEPSPRERYKRHRTRDEDASQVWKKEHDELEAARIASLIDEEARLLRLRGELLMVLLLVRSTIDGVVISEYSTRQLVDRRRFVPQVFLTYHPILYTSMHWEQLHVFCWGWGKWKVSARVKFEYLN